MPVKNAKMFLRDKAIPALRHRSFYFDVTSIRQLLREEDIRIEHKTLTRYLHTLMEDSCIYNAGRGWYSSIEKKFQLGTESVKEIISVIDTKFPLLEYSCWSTQQINRFMHHLLAKYVRYVYTDKDAMPSLFNYLGDSGYDVYLNPTRREVDKSFSIEKDVVVIRPTISKSPVRRDHNAPIEKILVDLCVELESVPIMDRSEFQRMAQNLVMSERIDMAKLLSYARRRKIESGDLFEEPQSIISTFARKWR